MKEYKKGSALIVVITTLSALLLVIAALWHAASVITLGAYERQVHYQYQHAVRGLLAYAIALCQDSASFLQTYTQPAQAACLDITAWPYGDQKVCRGRIVVFRQDNDLMLQAMVYDHEKLCSTVACTMRYVYDSSKVAYSDMWRVDAQG